MHSDLSKSEALVQNTDTVKPVKVLEEQYTLSNGVFSASDHCKQQPSLSACCVAVSARASPLVQQTPFCNGYTYSASTHPANDSISALYTQPFHQVHNSRAFCIIASSSTCSFSLLWHLLLDCWCHCCQRDPTAPARLYSPAPKHFQGPPRAVTAVHMQCIATMALLLSQLSCSREGCMPKLCAWRTLLVQNLLSCIV